MTTKQRIRRRELLYSTAALLTSVSAFVIAGCSPNPQSGPAEIAWDRDTCAYCRMVISDRAYAAQIRGGTRNEAYKFDDLGCAVNWLNNRGWSLGDVEIWVADHRHQHASHWLDARTARYVSGQTTPMDYEFGAVDVAGNDSVDFATARKRMLNREQRR